VDVLQKIFEFAEQRPDDRAMVHELMPVTYRDLHRKITAMRHKLAACDLPPGGVAVLWIHSVMTSWAVNLALRSLGLTTVSIRTPDEFAGFDSLDVVAIVTSSDDGWPAIDPALAPGAARIVVRAADLALGEDDGVLEPPPDGRPGDHILLTSGTTGNYKMMVVDSRAHAAEVQIGIKQYLERQGDGATELRGCVNILNLGLWTAVGYNYPLGVWTAGASVIIHQGPEEYRSFLIPGITHAMVTPAFLVGMLAGAPPDFPRNDDLVLMVTGGPLSVNLANLVRARLTNRILITLGSTESGGWATTPVATDEDLRWHRLHANRTVEVVDEDGRPLPPGRLGEVRVLLDSSFTGYLNDPDATASFVRGRWFYPGDLGVLDGKGRIALHGRVTDVLNIMGSKIATAPYEAALQEALGLEGVCLMSEQGVDREEQLHVVLETAEPIDQARLQEAAQAHLGGFPAALFHFVDRFPRNAMGKVERFKLKQRLVERQYDAQAQA
jgi:acyl-coenzyme A synthetase/AMP-(fatty) acid ligase